MLIEDEDIPGISQQQPCEPDDQFDDDLMRDLEKRKPSQSQ